MRSRELNHPFGDGNKRVSAFAAILFAESNGHEFLETPDELVETTCVAVSLRTSYVRPSRNSVDSIDSICADSLRSLGICDLE